jgi:hypothetical protein
MEPSIRKETETEASKKPPNRFLKAVGSGLIVFVHIVPIMVFLYAVVAATIMAHSEWHYPLWLSVICGLGSVVLVMAVLSSGAGTLFEIGIRFTIILALGLILLPIFSRVHHGIVTSAH